MNEGEKQNDIELLELAAKAAGIELKKRTWIDSRGESVEPGSWNPLLSDGDALRLAVMLGISVDLPDPEKLISPHSKDVDILQEGIVTALIRGDGYRCKSPNLKGWRCRIRWVSMQEFNRVKNCNDVELIKLWIENCPEKFENAYSATRRAIVLAAAEIGRSMK